MKYHLELDLELLKNPYKGMYLAVEGADGCGKTTQAKILAKYFKEKGKEVILTREPRKKGIIGDLVQEVLRGEKKIPPKAFQYLFTTDRVVHYETVIIPALKEGKIIISDRCFWSALVYGILDKEVDFDKKNLNLNLIAHSILSMYHRFMVPDYTFYLESSLETSLKRTKTKDDQKEIYETKTKMKRAIEGYSWLFSNFKNEVIWINGEQSVKKVTEDILKNIKIRK